MKSWILKGVKGCFCLENCEIRNRGGDSNKHFSEHFPPINYHILMSYKIFLYNCMWQIWLMNRNNNNNKWQEGVLKLLQTCVNWTRQIYSVILLTAKDITYNILLLFLNFLECIEKRKKLTIQKTQCKSSQDIFLLKK